MSQEEFSEEVGLPLREGGIRISRAKEDPDREINNIIARIRPYLAHDEQIHPCVLLSFVCSNSGKASRAIAEGEKGLAQTLILEQIGWAIQALRGLRDPE